LPRSPATAIAAAMPLLPIVALTIIAFAAGWHLYWALGGKTGYRVSLPQRPDGTPVMAHRLAWWRPAAAGVAVTLIALGVLVLMAERSIPASVSPRAVRPLIGLTGAAFVLRAIVPTPWTGFLKSIRSTRWAHYDSWLYSPLFLILGALLLDIAFSQ
jgi:hypothetical protein